MDITRVDRSRLSEVDFDNLGFGQYFSDHMYSIVFKNDRWQMPKIEPYGPIEILPSMCSLHYGQLAFDGFKAFYNADGRISIFRPETHHARLNRSSRMLCMPEIEYSEFLQGLETLVRFDKEWVPKNRGCALYIRPLVFATDCFLGVKPSKSYRLIIMTSPVGAYFKEGFNPVKLVTSGNHVRAVRGGLGSAKVAANYAAALYAATEAKKQGFSEVLWLDGVERKYIDEVGAMNLFVLLDDELVTPPVDEGTILSGVTRDSVLHIAKDWGLNVRERRISIDEIFDASDKGKLKEIFGTGTAAVVSGVGEITHNGKRLVISDGQIGPVARKMYDEVTGIQYGEKPDKYGWCHYT